jgi:hypothetical protein
MLNRNIIRIGWSSSFVAGEVSPGPGRRLLGSIAEGPDCIALFQITGPEKTASRAKKTFRRALEGFNKE